MRIIHVCIFAMTLMVVEARNTIAQERRPAVLTAKLTKHEVVPSEKTSLIELLPAGMKPTILGVDHRVYRIGVFDKDLKQMTNLPPSQYEIVDANIYFSSLPKFLSFSHAMDFEIIDKRNGTEFSFSANRLGIFLIWTRWHYEGDKGTVESQPVILVVSPPLDEKGRPQIKIDWLRTD